MLHSLDDPVALPPLTAGEREQVIRRGTALRRRRRALQAGIASTVGVIAVVAAVALSTIPSLDAGPVPVGNQTPSPSSSSIGPAPAPTTGPFDAVVLRGTRLVALDSTGHERWSRDLADSGLTAVDLGYPYVSAAGWLSLEKKQSMALLDLNDPRAPLRTMAGFFDSRAWSPNGLLLATNWGPPGGGELQAFVVDPSDGSRVNALGFTGGGPDPAWTADSTGLLINDDDTTNCCRYAVRPVAGGPLQTEIPTLWLRGSRYVTTGGRELQNTTVTLTVTENSGAAAVWYQRDLGELTVVDSSFTADGEAAWLLLKDANGSPALTLARADATRQTRVISTTPVNSNKWNFFTALAPDDSMLIATSVTNADSTKPTIDNYFLRTDGSTGIHLDGHFVGWIPHSVVDQLP